MAHKAKGGDVQGKDVASSPEKKGMLGGLTKLFGGKAKSPSASELEQMAEVCPDL